jgi:hypothetical protein
MKTKAFCNGVALGQHAGMFSRFEFDLSPHLKAGTNLISLYVSMERIPKSDLAMGEAVTVNLTASKVRSLSKGMFGPLAPGFDNRSYDLHGIWQPVRLLVRGTASLDDVWFTPSLEGAEIRVTANSTLKRHQVFLKAKWTDAGAEKVFAEVGPEKMVLNGVGRETLWLSGAKPKLWTPAEPNLYRLDVTLEDDKGQLLDSWSRNVGFRTFEIRGNQFFLNGKPYWLRGANHLPYGKNPFDPELPRRLIQLLHDANVRITRTHATPWNEAWLDAADEIGLAVSVEGIRPWGLAGKIGPTPPDFFQHWLMENEDVIKRCRNHPSVFIYTVGNEMMLRDTKNKEKWEQLSAVVKATRRVDPTRPVIASSEYQRETQTYRSLLQPNGLDDGDIDDIHRYGNWYGPVVVRKGFPLRNRVRQQYLETPVHWPGNVHRLSRPRHRLAGFAVHARPRHAAGVGWAARLSRQRSFHFPRTSSRCDQALGGTASLRARPENRRVHAVCRRMLVLAQLRCRARSPLSRLPFNQGSMVACRYRRGDRTPPVLRR